MSSEGPTETWTEAMLRSLGDAEHDFQEYKSSLWMVDDAEELRHSFPMSLGKQVSAFANGAGGRLFIGIRDSGSIDGGLPTDLKGGGTRAWLEDMVPNSVDPQLQSCNVFEVTSNGEQDTMIKPGRAVYVVSIPKSDHAPHQAKDHRYYLRIAGKSRPMGHVHIQDVLRRTRHPQIRVTRVGPYGEPELDQTDPRGRRAFIQLRAFVANDGRNLAKHVGVELIVPRALCGREVRRRMVESGETHSTQKPGELTFFRYHPSPIFPTQELYASRVWIGLHPSNLGLVRGGAELRWVIYADDAPPVTGMVQLNKFAVVQRATEWVALGDSEP